MKKHANTACHKANFDQYLLTLTFFQSRSSSVTNRANADAEVIALAMIVSRSQANTSAGSYSATHSSQVSSFSSATSQDPIACLLKATLSTKSETIWVFTCKSHDYSDSST